MFPESMIRKDLQKLEEKENKKNLWRCDIRKKTIVHNE